jgi:DNA-binding SARP family transcriptional activator
VLIGPVVRRPLARSPERLAVVAGLSVAELRTTVSRLRARTGREVIETTPAGDRIGTADVDADRFEELLDRARTAEGSERIELLESALALSRGEPYGEHVDRETIRADAVRLADLRANAEEPSVTRSWRSAYRGRG